MIPARKIINQLIKKSRIQAKPGNCYYCNIKCDSFCNSHTLPAFCLRNIASNGKVAYSNTILDLPILNDSKGVNEAGTFQLICRDCDSKIFQDYENPDNYKTIPSAKMLAQIDMKNNLKNISKRLMEIEIYDLMREQLGVSAELTQAKTVVEKMDLKEFKDAYTRAKKHSIKPFERDYYIGFYEKLSYVVPVAFQGSIALISDLDGNIISNIYNCDAKYKIQNIALCIFPLKENSIIMMFVEKNINRYSRFFKQLRKLDGLDDRLSVINYILFSYTEDYFLSVDIPQILLDELRSVSSKTPELISFIQPNLREVLEIEKENFNLQMRHNIPNLLSKEYSINREKGI